MTNRELKSKVMSLGYVPANMTAVVTTLGAKLPALRVVSGTWVGLQ